MGSSFPQPHSLSPFSFFSTRHQDAMAAPSTSSSRKQRPRLRPDLPLIWCNECGKAEVVERLSTTLKKFKPHLLRMPLSSSIASILICQQSSRLGV
jgi:hypothetical protein